MKLFIAALIILTLCGCSTKTLNINSKPEGAIVKIYNPQTGQFSVIGKTPFLLKDNKDIPENLKSAEVWSIALEMKGYVIEHIVFDRTMNYKFTITSNLKKLVEWADNKDFMMSQLADDVGRAVQKINGHIQSGNYESALKLNLSMIEKHPNSSIFFDIKGSIHLLRGERGKAEASYRKSLQLNPDNSETKRVLDRMTQGGRL